MPDQTDTQNTLFTEPKPDPGATQCPPPDTEEELNEAEKSIARLGEAKATLADMGFTFPPHDFGPGTEPGIYAGVPEEAYHAHPALSRSVLAEAARKSPLHAYHRWKGDEDESTSDAASLGTALHSRVLTPGVFKDTYDVAPDTCEDTKADGDPCSYSAKVRHNGTWYCGTHAPDTEPDDIEVLKASTFGDVRSMAGALEQDPDAAPLLFDLPGLSEITLLWEDEATGLMCKARPDRVGALPDYGSLTIVDLKSTRSAHPEDFRRKVARYGYWLQPPFYALGMRQAADISLTIRDFVFTCVESSAPYAVQCFRPLPKERGPIRDRMCTLIDQIGECAEEDRWPSYEDGISQLGIKRYEKERLGIAAA